MMPENSYPSTHKPSGPNAKVKAIVLLGSILIVLLSIGITFLFFEYKSLNDKLNDSAYLQQLQIEGQEEYSKRVLEEVGSLIVLPNEQNPTLATINDLETLKKDNPEFYENAENGDILLIYSKKAFIYRRNAKKLVNVAPVVSDVKGK